MRSANLVTTALIAWLSLTPAFAEIRDTGTAHYALHHEAQSSLSPEALWTRLIHPESWWSDAHTYSGKAINLSLDASAGGLWREDWDGGSVAHGVVLSALPPTLLRLNAPFGPLQGLGVTVIWTIEIKPRDGGSTVTFTEVATGSPASTLAPLAAAVDQVKTEAISRLVDQQPRPIP